MELCKRAGDPRIAAEHASRAVEIARRVADPNLEASALSRLGMTDIAANRIEDGFRLLDEAMAIATGGEVEDPLAVSDACCTMLVACERIAEHARARDWSRAISDFMRRRNYMPLYPWCRAIYAGFLVTTGRWIEAERELQSPLRHAEAFENANRVAPLAWLADLRVRQGRLEEAEQLLIGCEDRAAALRPVVEIDIARSRIELARERVEQQIEAAGEQDGLVAPLLALRVRIAMAASARTVAREAADALATMAARARPRMLSPRSRRARAATTWWRSRRCGPPPRHDSGRRSRTRNRSRPRWNASAISKCRSNRPGAASSSRARWGSRGRPSPSSTRGWPSRHAIASVPPVSPTRRPRYCAISAALAGRYRARQMS